jgi:hypothetical protein
MASYQEDLARWRLERKQQEMAARVDQMATEYRQAIRERDQAIADGDTETASFRDDDCIQLEKEYMEICPPQPPPMDPRAREWILRNKTFFDRHGPQANAAVQAAHAWLTRPGNAGWRVNSREYFNAIESLLEMEGPSRFGVRYDPKEKSLTANQVAKATGLSAQEYNRASKEIAAQGRFSFQNKEGR